MTKSIAAGSQTSCQETDTHLVARPFLESDLGLSLASPASQHLEVGTMQDPLDPYLPDAVLVVASAAAAAVAAGAVAAGAVAAAVAAVAAASAAASEACSSALATCLLSQKLEL